MRYADKIETFSEHAASMTTITIEHNVTPAKLDVMYVDDWPVWTKGVSEFDWEYDQQETCYILEGQVIVTPDGDEGVAIGPGDLVTFPKGMSCSWKITQPIKKHYRFG